MKRFCECHHPDCNICKICNKYEQRIAELELLTNISYEDRVKSRITELETANKGLQIALLDANEKEKEPQLRNAMLVDAAKNYLQHSMPTRLEHEHINSQKELKNVLSATSTQSAEWLENSHREWMKGLPVGAYVRFWAREYMAGCEVEHDEGMEICLKDGIGDDGMPATPLYAIPQLPEKE